MNDRPLPKWTAESAAWAQSPEGRKYIHQLRYGTENKKPVVPRRRKSPKLTKGRVPAEMVKPALEMWISEGWSYEQIHAAVGMNKSTIAKIRKNKQYSIADATLDRCFIVVQLGIGAALEEAAA